MKNMMLITIRDEISQMYGTEFRKIFNGYANVSTYSFENKDNEPFNKSFLENMDLIVITSNNVYSLIRNHIDESIPIVYVHFTFMQSKIEILKSYPRDTNAYIGFKSYSASFQTVSLLYELGLSNLNLRVYDPTHVNINDIDIAITSENSSIFPQTVKNIFSIGKRKISFMTIMDIATQLSIMDDNLENRIYYYCEGMAVHGNCLNYFYDKSTNVKVQLETIINCIDDAFVLLNHKYMILHYNNQLLNMFNINKFISNMNILDIPEFIYIYAQITSNSEFKNKLVSLETINKKILLSKKKITDRDNEYEICILIIKDVTNIIDLENTLRKQLLKKGHIAKYDFNNIKGQSLSIKTCIEKAKRISSIDKTTLIIGESGTGKELFAQAIHKNSIRSKFPFIAVNCAALPATLLESELFGYEDGSFTGAKKGGKIGLFEAAHRGTLFLDEIGEMSLETQAKLLRVLEEKEIMKVGSNEIISIDVKIIGATNKNLKDQVHSGKFRLDLFYRLNTIMLKIPALRERESDIRFLAQVFLINENYPNKKLSNEVMSFMLSYPWQGNVRELKNCIEYMANISDDIITKDHIPDYMFLDDLDNVMHVTEDLKQVGNVSFHEYEATIKTLEILTVRSMGRRNILEALHSQNILISEYKLRSILESLNQKGYVFFGKGRSGAIITTEGRNALLNGLYNSSILA